MFLENTILKYFQNILADIFTLKYIYLSSVLGRLSPVLFQTLVRTHPEQHESELGDVVVLQESISILVWGFSLFF